MIILYFIFINHAGREYHNINTAITWKEKACDVKYLCNDAMHHYFNVAQVQIVRTRVADAQQRCNALLDSMYCGSIDDYLLRGLLIVRASLYSVVDVLGGWDNVLKHNKCMEVLHRLGVPL